MATVQAAAERLGLSLEDYRDARKREAAETAAANQLGLSVEAFRMRAVATERSDAWGRQRDGGCTIGLTELRALSLAQLVHVARLKFGGGVRGGGSERRRNVH